MRGSDTTPHLARHQYMQQTVQLSTVKLQDLHPQPLQSAAK
ncbi:hypothetical protein [Chitinophaga tropicalis]|nr:hypothetical protein [Chitinophaga tropicalis]